MPPKRSKKSKMKEDPERQKILLSAKERILSKKRFLLEIVEKLIEDEVHKDWFLANCSYLCQADFNDVVQERSIESLCGYPLCSNPIKEAAKQKYRISHVVNKVYDLTERKCFCSNQCYKASNYVRAQLSEIPLYMRKEEKINLHLLSDCDNKGSVGEEVQFHHTIPQEEIDKFYSEETANHLQNLLNEDIKKCADSLSGLQIKEHVFEKQYVFSDETPNKSDKSTLKNKNGSHSESDLDSDDSVDEILFPSYDNEKSLSNRHMPVPQINKKSVLIPPQKSDVKPTSQTSELSLSFVRKVFKDWMSENTIKYLLGEKYVYGVKADNLFKKMTESEFPCSEKLASIKEEYIKLCLKIDSLPDDDDDDFIDSPEIFISESNSKKIETENNSAKKVFKRRPKKSKDKNKHVTFAETHPEKKEESLEREKDEASPEEKVKVDIELKTKESIELLPEKNTQPQTNENVSLNNDGNLSSKEKLSHSVEEKAKQNARLLRENENPVKTDGAVILNNVKVEKEALSDLSECQPVYPLIDSDSVSQNIFRRQVLTKNLKSVYAELLPVAGLHYTDIRENIRKFVDSLSLTPSNIIYKPKEWKLIALVLFRMLTRTVLKELHDELQFAKLCEDPLMPITVDLREIENLVCELVSPENISVH